MARSSITRNNINRSDITRSSLSSQLVCIGDSITEPNALGVATETNRYTNRLLSYLQATIPAIWELKNLGMSNWGTILLDQSISMQGDAWPPNMLRKQWETSIHPNLIIIELGVNNVGGGWFDWCYRYDGRNNPGRGYATDAEALVWAKFDLTNIINFLHNTAKIPLNQILVCGTWPHGKNGTFRGERFVDGAQQAIWDTWNSMINGIGKTVIDLGATFVPMQDVFSAGYNPNSDPSHYIYHGDNIDVHLSDAGHGQFYNRLKQYLPTVINNGRKVV